MLEGIATGLKKVAMGAFVFQNVVKSSTTKGNNVNKEKMNPYQINLCELEIFKI